MKKLLVAVLLLVIATLPSMCKAECYPSAGGLPTNNSPDCVVVNAYVNGSGQSVTVSPTAPMPTTLPTGDVCQNPTIAKVSASIVISTATTTQLVALSASKIIYVCSLNFTTGGTTPTYQFKYGTQTTTPCDTGAANISGAFAPVSGSTFIAMGSGVLMQTTASQQLCVTTGGTTPAANGFITFVQM